MNISQLLTKLKTLVYSKNEMDTKLITKANDSAVVHTSGAEDISGDKNFIDNLTRGGKNVDAIEEQGANYIRYTSGLQICWGEHIGAASGDSITINFPKSFDRHYGISVSVNGQSEHLYAIGWDSSKIIIGKPNAGSFTYTAIGRWK